MTDNSGNLAALVGSRICHDLISPIGAIGNGVELLEMAGAAPGPELNLIAESVGNAQARIRFFRIAYGLSGDQTMGAAEIAPILDSLNAASRVKLHWAPTGALPRAEIRMAFLAFQCCDSAMPLGGTVTARCESGTWTIEAKASKIIKNNKLWGIFNATCGNTDVAPAHVQFALLPVAAADAGRVVSADFQDDCLTVTF